jgi:hypothetical protein
MGTIRLSEDSAYDSIAAREGISVDEVKTAAFNFMVSERNETSGIYSNIA